MNNKSIKICLAIGIIFLFFVSTITPMVFGYMAISKTEESVDEYYDFDRFVKHSFPEGYDPDDEDYLDILSNSYNNDIFSESEIATKSSNKEIKQEDDESQLSISDGPMDSSWPMYGHDARHTGLSPYSTADNPYYEKWRCTIYENSDHSSPVIDKYGIIYVGRGENIYAIYPNGTVKWNYKIKASIHSAPALDEDGVLYIGSSHPHRDLYAIYTSNGTLKWKYPVGADVDGSPAIDSDGTIYFSNWNGDIFALNSDGTLKWKYHTGNVVTSAPAIGLDGTIYCGSLDNYVYALYPNNGTVKWKYNTGNWVHGSPSIGSDGTVYIGSDNNLLYAFYPNNGSVKWTCGIGAVWGSPAIGEDGTLYVGTFQQYLYAISPDGVSLWNYAAPGRIWLGASAAISADGSIYFGTTWMDGGEGAFIVLNPDGTERFKYQEIEFEFESSPAIDCDGTVYVCSSYHGEKDFGLLHAFGKKPSNVPEAPNITGPNSGKLDIEYEFTFKATSPLGTDLYYLIDFDDAFNYNWLGPYASGEEIKIKHTYRWQKKFEIKARVKDVDNLWSVWSDPFNMSISKSRSVNIDLLLKIQEHFPLITRLLKIF